MITLLLILTVLFGIYLLTCTPCRQHLTGKLKNLLVNPKCLFAVSIAILLTIVAVYTVSGKKEIGFFTRETKCENAVKNEFGVFLASGDCTCNECAKEKTKKAGYTTPRTPIDTAVVSGANQ